MLIGSGARTGADIILGQHLHLMLRPGAERMPRLAGAQLRRLAPSDRSPIPAASSDVAVRASQESTSTASPPSYIDGSRHEMSPERSIEIQGLLGSDIQMQARRMRAAAGKRDRDRRAMGNVAQMGGALQGPSSANQPGKGRLFGIVQGGDVPKLRERSLRQALSEPRPEGATPSAAGAVGEPASGDARQCST